MLGRHTIGFRGSHYPVGTQLKPILASLALDQLTFCQTLELHIVGRTLVYCDNGVIWLCKEHDAYCFSYRRLTEIDVRGYVAGARS